MTDPLAHQIATRAIGGRVYVVTLRDTSDGSEHFTVGYASRGTAQPWLSRHRFDDRSQCDAACSVLSDFLTGEEFKS